MNHKRANAQARVLVEVFEERTHLYPPDWGSSQHIVSYVPDANSWTKV